MNCPKCVGKLQHKNIEGIDVDSCYVCEGIWFDAGELEQALKRDLKSFDFVSLNDKEFDGAEVKPYLKMVDNKEGKCPHCQVILIKKKYNDVNIDACVECHGIWLDGGEIQKLRVRFFANVKSRIDYCIDFLKNNFSKKSQ